MQQSHTKHMQSLIERLGQIKCLQRLLKLNCGTAARNAAFTVHQGHRAAPAAQTLDATLVT